jgi:hypothetical protein
MVTTICALIAALPLALETGAGSELRRPLGITIVGGLLASQWITLYTTPIVYLYLDRLNELVKAAIGRRFSRRVRGAGPSLAARAVRPRAPTGIR